MRYYAKMHVMTVQHYTHLTSEKRYYIYLSLQKGLPQKEIANALGVNKSTISREVRRNSTINGKYVWDKAQTAANERKTRSVNNNMVSDVIKWQAREILCSEQWSPDQISAYLKMQGLKISRNTIYRMIHEDDTGNLRRHCRHQLRYKHHRKKRHETKATNIKNRVSIHDRPKEANGSRFGDWEMDLIVDRDSNAILTLVERSTDFLLMHKLPNGKTADCAARIAWRLLLPYKGKILTITTDNGSEFARHEWLSAHLNNVPIYFTDSFASWQKGNIENTNKLIRQYIPKKMNISTISDGYIQQIQLKLNSRPRQKLKFNTPKNLFFKKIV